MGWRLRCELALPWAALAAVPPADWAEVRAYMRVSGLDWAGAAATAGWRRRRDLQYAAWEQEGLALRAPPPGTVA